MFADTGTAARIEGAEAATMRAMVEALVATGRAADAFVRALGGGVAAFARAGSPINKVIGAGLAAPLDEDALAAVEEALHARGEPVRVELATLAVPETGAALTARGYRLLGFENVLARALGDGDGDAAHASTNATAARDDGVRVERMTAATARAWQETLVDGFALSDDTGVPVDAPARDAIAAVLDDFLAAPDFDRYLAWTGGVVAGAASMRVSDGVALLTGSATLAAHRRHGVQAALIAARLADARARGASLAVITTAPGSQSQANVTRRGFALVYARAALVRPPRA